MRKHPLILIGVVLGLFIVAGLLWTPGYNRAGVHPALLAIEEPLQQADAHYYFDGGTIRLGFVDARGQIFGFTLPVKYIGKEQTYPELIVEISPGRRVKHPCSGDSQKFVAMLIDKYAAPGHDRRFCLEQLSNAPLHRLTRWWYFMSR